MDRPICQINTDPIFPSEMFVAAGACMWWPLLVTDSEKLPRTEDPCPWGPQVQGYFTFYYLMSLKKITGA